LLAGDDLTIVLFFVGTAVSLGCAAMSTAGWRHPALIITLFGLAAICFAFGAGWPAIKEISPPVLSAPVHQIATSPVAWFAVLILGLTASILLPRRRSRFVESKPREPVALRHQPERPVKPAEPPQERIFIDISPEYLIGLYDGRTSIQADALAAMYIGKWMSVTSDVSNVYKTGSGVHRVLAYAGNRIISFDFGKNQQVAYLVSGSTFTAIGEIEGISRLSVDLIKCELKAA
jgi:hypothetical protein